MRGTPVPQVSPCAHTAHPRAVARYLHAEGLDEDFQVVAFHPHHRFGGEGADAAAAAVADDGADAHIDAGDYVNRSPHPAVHVLRQPSVTAAVDGGPGRPESSEVPRSNAARLRALGIARMEALLRGVRKDTQRTLG